MEVEQNQLTPEQIELLTQALQESIQKNDAEKANLLLGLSNLVNQAPNLVSNLVTNTLSGVGLGIVGIVSPLVNTLNSLMNSLTQSTIQNATPQLVNVIRQAIPVQKNQSQD